MAKNWMLRRDDAELLVDVLEAQPEGQAWDLAAQVRVLFGMVTREQELAALALPVQPAPAAVRLVMAYGPMAAAYGLGVYDFTQALRRARQQTEQHTSPGA